jgi:hypothetical protein
MRENMMDKTLSPIHPGEILLEDFMKPLGLSQYRLAHDFASARLLMAGVQLLLILPCVLLATLAQVRRFGFVYKFGMIWKLQNAN